MNRALAATAALLLLAAPHGAPAAPVLTVGDVWSRPATQTGVVYMTMRNRGRTADTIVGASSPVARAVEIHETTPMSGMPGMSNVPGISGMAMKRRTNVAIAPGGTLRFKPGGYHVMLIGLRHPLALGERVPVTLRFRSAGTVYVVSRVEDRAL